MYQTLLMLFIHVQLLLFVNIQYRIHITFIIFHETEAVDGKFRICGAKVRTDLEDWVCIRLIQKENVFPLLYLWIL